MVKYSCLYLLNQLPKKADEEENASDENLMVIEVNSPSDETVVPSVGDIVTARIKSVNQRYVLFHNEV